MQVDDPTRGISYKNKGPLDMRMDKRIKTTGADLLLKLSQQELSEALWELSDEPDHEKIAAAVVHQRQTFLITQTSHLVRLIFNAKGLSVNQWKQQQAKQKKFGSLHPAARTFQALRIMVNDELGALRQLLRIAPACLNPGGRIGIISFHSGEDRLVKQAFKQGKEKGIYSSIAQNPIQPRKKEILANPRSSSAKFRWAIKSE
jgi:16S rRNA (cytosine1402-N4)-methyltransferase